LRGKALAHRRSPPMWMPSTMQPKPCVWHCRRAQLAVSTAEDLDRDLERLPDAMLAQFAAAGNPIKLSRAEHCVYHLDEIEQLIG
jgi:hypothetical protein